MTWLSPFERALVWRRRRRILIALLAGYLVLALLDRPVFHLLYLGEDTAIARRVEAGEVFDLSAPGAPDLEDQARRHRRLADLEIRDWYRTFRVIGSLWLWAMVAGALALADAGTPRIGHAARIFVSAALAGLFAEVVKLFFGRERPIDNSALDGEYVYKGLWERFTDPAHGMPSSHVAVAFGGAVALAYLFPRITPVVVAAAVGCAMTRLVTGAHFLTDVSVGALLGYTSARLLRPGGWAGPRGSRAWL